MASREAVGQSLAVLGATFPRDITPELVAVWLEVFADVDDDALGRATRKALAVCRFFPVPSELREMIGANRVALPDTEAMLETLRGLSDYHPVRGTTPPSGERVRQVFGDAAAEAYGMAGGGRRLFSGNETTASIARREFDTALAEAVQVHGPVSPPRLALPSGSRGGPVYFDAPREGGPARIGSGALGSALSRLTEGVSDD
jgi:hypothetical protein